MRIGAFFICVRNQPNKNDIIRSRMDKVDRKILEYLKNRDWIALGAILEECSEATESRLHSLHQKGYLDFNKYVGSGNTDFFRPNEKGTRALLPFCTNAINYISQNLLAIIALILSVIALLIK